MYYRSTFAKATADKAIGDVNTTHDAGEERREASGGRRQASGRQATGIKPRDIV